VYQIRNLHDGRVLVEATPNLRTINGRRMELRMGKHRNARLRADVAALGPDAFAFEVLEVLPEPEDPRLFPRDALKTLEAAWLARLQPWGTRGYNDPPAAGRRG
jgi:hypothetical protein